MLPNNVSFLEGIDTDFCAKHSGIRDLLVSLLIDRDDAERVCAIFGQNELTIGDLAESAYRVAASLVSYDIVAICMQASLELIIALCGVILRGIPYVPLDPSLPLERLKYILDDSQAKLVIVDSISLFENSVKTVTCSQLCSGITRLDVNKMPKVNDEDTFCLMYTSGSTGRPKGVYLPHRALINRLYWQWSQFPFNKEDVCCLKPSISFVDSIADTFAPLLGKIPIVILSKLLLHNIDQLISVLTTRRVSQFVLVPSLLTALVDHLKNNNKTLPALRLVVSGGETLPITLIESFFALKQRFSPTCCLVNAYGSTEVMADATYEVFESTNHLYDRLSLHGRTSIGYPIANMRVDIVEPNEQGIGELVVTGEGVANGYHNVDSNNVALSNKFIRTNDGQLRFRTGDFGKIWNDRIIFYGRNDNLIKIAGNRIDLSEIELILKQYCNCRQPIATYLAATAQIVVFLRTSEEVVDLNRESLSKYLPSYAIPSQFISVADFPLLVSGKIDRQQLIKSLDIVQEITPPSQGLNEELDVNRDFYSALADIGISHAHTDRNFFAAGGTSQSALLLVAKLHRIGFHNLTVEGLMKAESLQDILLHRITYSNWQHYHSFFECDSEYQVIPLEHVDKQEGQRMLVEAFVNHYQFDEIVHQNRADLKLQCKREWHALFDAIWKFHVAGGLSFGALTNDGQLAGITLAHDLIDLPDVDLSRFPLITSSWGMLDAAINYLLEELRSRDAFPQRIMYVSLEAVNPSMSPERRLSVAYFLGRESLRLAAAKGFQAVLSDNTSSAIQQFAEHVFKYDINRVVRTNEWRDSSGALMFPHAKDNHVAIVSMKFLTEQ